ncbi:MAG: alpha-E domain-containing protein [Oceanococcus sp.]
MLSRVAESFYWFGRYVERAENTARLILNYSDLVLDLPLRSKVEWYQLIEITGAQESFNDLYKRNTETAVLRFMIDDEKYHGSIRNLILRSRENLRPTRDRIPRELSESVNDLRQYVIDNSTDSIRRGAARVRYLRGLIERCQILRGYMGGSMSRTESYYFIRFGRMLERADMTTRIMDVRIDDLVQDEIENLPAFDAIQWMSILRSLSAYQMYRREVQGKVQSLDVIEFLFLNKKFPRSVEFSLNGARQCLSHLPRCEEVMAPIAQLIDEVDRFKPKTLANDSAKLRDTIDKVQADINSIHTHFVQNYFAPDVAQSQQQNQS